MRTWIAVLVVSLVCTSTAAAGQREWLRPLQDPDVDPHANQLRFRIDSSALTTRVLLAGDSWAQYMWDDGSHNVVFDRFGFGDRRALSESESQAPDPDIGYTGPAYSVSGSAAKEWVDTSQWPYLANTLAALRDNPDIDTVVLSIGGNDMLDGKSDGGWYKDMDLDVPGSEAALLAQVQNDTATILDSILAVRPDIQVVLSSYDYPNFNVGFWCFLSACQMRRNLSRDPDNDLVTDAELNAMLVTFEATRIELANAHPRVHYDHAVGLMHYFFGDGITGPGILPYPGQDPPLYAPFPGGNPLRPTPRLLFRRPNGIDADPIHLNATGYLYKITNQMQSWFLPRWRGDVTASFESEGGDRDGWTDGTQVDVTGITVGDNGAARAFGFVSFDTSGIPDGATVTRAALYLHRAAAAGTNPFADTLRVATVDMVSGSFGAPPVEAGDATALASASAVGAVIGSVSADGDALRIELDPAALPLVNDSGLTQFRLQFAGTDGDADPDAVTFHTGGTAAPVPAGPPTLASTLGSASPLLDVTYEEATDVADHSAPPAVSGHLRAEPNPFNPSTRLSFELSEIDARDVTLRVYDSAGRRVRTLRIHAPLAPGTNDVLWDGRDDRGRRLASGIYHVRLVTRAASSSTKLVLLR